MACARSNAFFCALSTVVTKVQVYSQVFPKAKSNFTYSDYILDIEKLFNFFSGLEILGVFGYRAGSCICLFLRAGSG